jgi:hypothetical protein
MLFGLGVGTTLLAIELMGTFEKADFDNGLI